jgi:hypothetical protein
MYDTGLEKASQGNSPSYMQSPSQFPIRNQCQGLDHIRSQQGGGALAAGGRPDKLSDSLFEALVAAVDGCPGEVHARCKSQFHRKENGAGYRKPNELNETLKMLMSMPALKLAGTRLEDGIFDCKIKADEIIRENGGSRPYDDSRYFTPLHTAYDTYEWNYV